MEEKRSDSPLKLRYGKMWESFQKAQKLYEQYYVSNDENLFEQLLVLTDSIYGKQVRNLLKQNGCFNEESEHTALQEARLAIWQQVRKCRENGKPDPDFIRYCKGIYYHKGMDVVRTQNTYRRRFSDKLGRAPVSLDAPLPDGGKNLGATIRDGHSDLESGISLDEQRWVFNSLFVLYCKCLVNAKAEPPRELALFYARIFPHVVEAIPEEKMASAKWAFEHMKGQTVQKLGEKSESEMRELINHTLRWHENFWRQLEQTICVGDEKTLLKDVIYTDAYSKNKIEDWSESMHRTVVKEAVKIVMKDSRLVESAVEYISDRDKIYCLIKGGRDR